MKCENCKIKRCDECKELIKVTDNRPNEYQLCFCGNPYCLRYEYSIFGQRGRRYYDSDFGEHFTFF